MKIAASNPDCTTSFMISKAVTASCPITAENIPSKNCRKKSLSTKASKYLCPMSSEKHAHSHCERCPDAPTYVPHVRNIRDQSSWHDASDCESGHELLSAQPASDRHSDYVYEWSRRVGTSERYYSCVA